MGVVFVNNVQESKDVLASYQPPDRNYNAPLGMSRRSLTPTIINIAESDNGSCSVLKLETNDRPGLLVDVVHVLKDININVMSAEIDTVGDRAVDELYITYHGEPLSAPMMQLANNALQFYLSLADVETEESY